MHNELMRPVGVAQAHNWFRVSKHGDEFFVDRVMVWVATMPEDGHLLHAYGAVSAAEEGVIGDDSEPHLVGYVYGDDECDLFGRRHPSITWADYYRKNKRPEMHPGCS